MTFHRPGFTCVVLRATALAAFVSLSLGVSALRAEPKWPLPEGLKSVEVNGYEMAYRDEGSGAPVVLVHGALSDYRIWNPVGPELAKRFRVITVGLRHHYPEKWDGKGSDYSYEQHAADVAAFIKTLNLGKVHLVGHSRGGGVVVNVAKNNPDVIKTLVLADATGFESMLPDTPEGQKLATASRDRIETLQKNLGAGNIELAAQMFVDSLNTPGTWAKRTPEQKQRLFDNLGTAAQLSKTPPTTCAQVAQFDFPMLLVHGENSPANFPGMSAAIRKCKTIAEPIVVPNAAHSMFVDNPAVFNAALLGFLSRDLAN
jgi:pimeloyl-ACP methyl ester carboxylesterase